MTVLADLGVRTVLTASSGTWSMKTVSVLMTETVQRTTFGTMKNADVNVVLVVLMEAAVILMLLSDMLLQKLAESEITDGIWILAHANLFQLNSPLHLQKPIGSIHQRLVIGFVLQKMELPVNMASTSTQTAAIASVHQAVASQTSPGTTIIALVNAMPLVSFVMLTNTGTRNAARASVMQVCQLNVKAIIILILILAIANVMMPTYQTQVHLTSNMSGVPKLATGNVLVLVNQVSIGMTLSVNASASLLIATT